MGKDAPSLNARCGSWASALVAATLAVAAPWPPGFCCYCQLTYNSPARPRSKRPPTQLMHESRVWRLAEVLCSCLGSREDSCGAQARPRAFYGLCQASWHIHVTPCHPSAWFASDPRARPVHAALVGLLLMCAS